MTASMALLRPASVAGTPQSPSVHNFSMDSTLGIDFNHFFISAAVRSDDRKANRSAQREVAAHVRKFFAVNPMPLEFRMYWLMCSAFRSTSLPASEMYMNRSASFAPSRFVFKIKSTRWSSSMVMSQFFPDLPVKEKTASCRPSASSPRTCLTCMDFSVVNP